MRRLPILVRTFALTAALLAGCDRTPGNDGGCLRPLNHYCEDSECHTWEQALAIAKEGAWDSGCDCSPFGADFHAGECGDLRYVQRDCRDAYTEFFDSGGTLVAASWWTDISGLFCPDSNIVHYGFIPACEFERKQDFCEELPDLVCSMWCANEPQGSSCYQGPPDSVQACHESCLQEYADEQEQSGCGDAWIHIKQCELDLDCEATLGECDWLVRQLGICRDNQS